MPFARPRVRSTMSAACTLLLVLSIAIGLGGCGTQDDDAVPRSPANTADRVLFPVEQDGRWGYIDRTGQVVIKPTFDQAWAFVDGRALVRQSGRFGFVDSSGQIVVEPTYRDAWHFSNGLAPVQKDSLWGFIDRSGNLVVDAKFRLAPDVVEEGRPAVAGDDDNLQRTTQNGRFGYRDASGDTVIAPRFDQAWYFRDGRARVKVDSLWGYIDRSGSTAIEPAFPRAWDFRNGLARVIRPSGERAYIDTTGATVWP